jgi:spore germination protein GerM
MTPRRRARTTLAAGVVAVVLGVAACTVPTNDEPVVLSGSVPFGLLDSTTTTASTSPEAITKQVVVYALANDNGTTVLTPVPRSVDVNAGVEEVLTNLFTQRPSDERPAEIGLSSAIPESATLLSATRSDSNEARIIVDVRGLFGSIQGVDLRDALAQIVWTATEGGTGIREVVFRNDGAEVQALVDDLESTEGAVNRRDYSREN